MAALCLRMPTSGAAPGGLTALREVADTGRRVASVVGTLEAQTAELTRVDGRLVVVDLIETPCRLSPGLRMI